mmetsp:Transcript_42594/g.93337  ORF Transcript_42594/g.93337 Transcript_42594/m.93337 type:complete len:338 (+) Transcript_42594:406-1419(+)
MSPVRRDCCALIRMPSRRSRRARSSSPRLRSASHACCSGASSSRRLASCFCTCASRFLLAPSFSRPSAVASISSWSSLRSSRSSCSGFESSCTRRHADASSIKSIALSGKKRWVMYLAESAAAATSAESSIRTPWCFSYRSRSPRRIETVASTLGSPTCTGCMRRSNAESFSTSRYSVCVVAPMQRSSPRASTGLSRLAASIAPSALPAPSTKCTSSMKRMIPGGGAAATSANTAFSLSSNSPRWLAPATSEPMSRVRSAMFCSPSGTSLARMRCARPSTTAVLPTPGSPTSTGLFFVRRVRIWMTRRISSSRPITGSSFPSAACATKSIPYFSSAS